MPSETTICLDDYLAITFRPDCEYVEGMLIQRNMGDYDHSSTQASLTGYLGSRQDLWNIREVVSAADMIEEMQYRIDDYVAFGVQNIWLVNPRTRRGFAHDGEGSREAKDGVLRTSDREIRLPLAEIFEGRA